MLVQCTIAACEDGDILRNPLPTCFDVCDRDTCCVRGQTQCLPLNCPVPDFVPKTPAPACHGASCNWDNCCEWVENGNPMPPWPSAIPPAPGPEGPLESMPTNMGSAWSCYDYLSNQNDQWCATVQEDKGYEYQFFAMFSPCGCRCCRKSLEADPAVGRPPAESMPSSLGLAEGDAQNTGAFMSLTDLWSELPVRMGLKQLTHLATSQQEARVVAIVTMTAAAVTMFVGAIVWRRRRSSISTAAMDVAEIE